MARHTALKKGSMAIEWGPMTVLQIVLLIMFMVLVEKAAVAALNPDEQTVLINVNLLKNKIDEACITGYASMNDFKFPQPSPPRFAGLTDIFAQIAIRTSGDPHYVLYYEAFPAGEAVGWETMHGFDYRIISPIDLKSQQVSLSEFKSSLEEHLQNVQNNVKSTLGIQTTSTPILVNNIILSNFLNVNPVEEPNKFDILKQDAKTKNGNAGAWKDKRFVFSQYNFLTQLDKTNIKYRPCEANSLCLKTRSGVYSFPLSEACRDNIKYIQLNYDATSTNKASGITAAGFATVGAVGLATGTGILSIPVATVTGVFTVLRGLGSALWSLVKISPTIGGSVAVGTGVGAGAGTLGLVNYLSAGILQNTITYKNSDFYVASPCSLTGIEVVREDCTCQKMYKYPIYSYNPQDNNVKFERDHYTCLDGIDSDATPELVTGQISTGKQCLSIKVSEPRSNYCWTPNALAPTSGWDSLYNLIPKNAVLNLAQVIGTTPVYTLNTYDYTNNKFMYVLKPSAESTGYLKRLAEFTTNTFSWKWPSGGF